MAPCPQRGLRRSTDYLVQLAGTADNRKTRVLAGYRGVITDRARSSRTERDSTCTRGFRVAGQFRCTGVSSTGACTRLVV
jgi:hypothetical protein